METGEGRKIHEPETKICQFIWKQRNTGSLLFFAGRLSSYAFASRSSFLYPCNDWNDANSYFSMGKALFNGKMPYRDVFDQKGPYLYFLYGLAYLVSHTTFAGVYILEGIWAFLDLLGIYYIMRLYLKRNTALFLSPAVLAVIVSSKSFYWGGSAEEICFPFLVWGLYLSIEYFKNSYPGKAVSFKVLFAGGLLAGMVANIKFTVLGFFFAWMMCMAFSFLAGKDFFGASKGLPGFPWRNGGSFRAVACLFRVESRTV